MTGYPRQVDTEADPPIPSSVSSGGGAGTFDSRLRDVERAVERIETKLDTELKHLATRAWVLGGVVGGMVSATLITLTVIRLFFPVSN